MFICPDAKILPGPEEHHTLHVTHRQELACQALPLPGWSPHTAAENLPSLEGWSQITLSSVCPIHPYLILLLYTNSLYPKPKAVTINQRLKYLRQWSCQLLMKCRQRIRGAMHRKIHRTHKRPENRKYWMGKTKYLVFITTTTTTTLIWSIYFVMCLFSARNTGASSQRRRRPFMRRSWRQVRSSRIKRLSTRAGTWNSLEPEGSLLLSTYQI